MLSLVAALTCGALRYGSTSFEVGTNLQRRSMIHKASSATFCAMAGVPFTACAADLTVLARRQLDSKPPIFPILAAQGDVKRLLDDEETFRTMITIGLPTGNLQMPPEIAFTSLKALEDCVKDPGTFMDASIEYVEYSRDANDLIALAKMSRTNGGGPRAVQDYLDRSLEAAKDCARALDRMVPLLPLQ